MYSISRPMYSDILHSLEHYTVCSQQLSFSFNLCPFSIILGSARKTTYVGILAYAC